VRYERPHKIADGSSIRLNVQLLPVTGSSGTAAIVFSGIQPINARKQLFVLLVDLRNAN
jgi:hypothetical protein